MADMKTLNINGTMFTIKDGDAVRVNEAQSFDDMQKAQARKNIGAAAEGATVWKLLASFDLSNGATSYEVDTAGCTELLMLTTQTADCSGQKITWKGATIGNYHLAAGSVGRMEYLGNGAIAVTAPRANTDTLLKSIVVTGADEENHIFTHECSSSNAGVVELWGRCSIAAADVQEENADHQAEYFTITDDGVVSLKPEYRGACTSSNSTFTYAISDNGLGAVGSKNAELPKHLTIPEVVNEIAVTALAPGMFMCNEEAETIVLPDLVTDIPERFCDKAFGLKQICNTENIQTIGRSAFQGAQFEKVKFPNLTSITGKSAFAMCAFLVYADIGKVTSIPDTTFNNCMKLSRIKGGSGITTIGETAFSLTYRLNHVEFLPNLTSIGNYAFVRSRLNYDWSSLGNCAFGTNATALQMNPTDIWSPCTVTAAENPVSTLLSQHDPRWATRAIGTSGKTYGNGCVFFTAMHIYCALHNLTLSSVEEFEEIVNAIDPDILNNYVTDDSYLKTILEGLGLTVEYYSSATQEALQALYDGLAAGKYATLLLYGSSMTHLAMIYGVKDNRELCFADSSLTSAQYNGRGEETIKYSMPYQNCTLTTYPIWIVSL